MVEKIMVVAPTTAVPMSTGFAVALKVGTGVSGFDLHTIIIAVLGAIVLLFAYRALSGRSGLRI